MATYAYYVWACYGITAVVLGLMAWLAKRSYATELQAAQRRLQMSKEKTV